MRIPISWLGEFVELNPELTPEQAHADFVSVGFEEEAIHSSGVTGPVVLGRVLEFTPEPQSNGKTINWCQVQVGSDASDVRGIVCGAHNFAVGDLVVACLPGAVLSGDFEIAARKTYGHISDGMLASARELGLGDDHDGILLMNDVASHLELGTDLKSLLGLDEWAVEINVTPDRGYAFSIRGAAREYALATKAAFTDPISRVTVAEPSGFSVTIADDAPIRDTPGCEVFVTRVVRGVDLSRETPKWMSTRLALAGIRSISLPVDITNYVMLETGNPIHGYDLDTLNGGLTVRRARAGEQLVTLDGVERTLHPEDLVIADDSGAIGLAGVMGGQKTEISDRTSDILVEVAVFDQVSIARSARRHKLGSEASKRYERGVDPNVAPYAAQRVVDLLVELGGGTADTLGSALLATVQNEPMVVPLAAFEALTGVPYTPAEIVEALQAVGVQVSERGEELELTAPSWRPDLTFTAAFVEEVARVLGYDRIPSVVPVAPPGRGFTRAQKLRRRVANALAAAGLTEVQSYPFVSSADNEQFGLLGQPQTAVTLSNALDAERAQMRQSLLPGLLEAAHRNVSRGLVDLALFEVGMVFAATTDLGTESIPPLAQRPSDRVLEQLNASLPAQPRMIAGLFTGAMVQREPGVEARFADWSDAVEAARTVAWALPIELELQQSEHPAMHPGRTAALVLRTEQGEQVLGYAGELAPSVTAAAHLPSRTAVFELNLDELIAHARREPQVGNISGYPAATQDLSLLVPRDVAVARVSQVLRENCGELLEELRLVDDYSGAGVPENLRSLTFALRFRAHDRTLTAAEANEAKMAGVNAAISQLKAQFRE